MISEYLRRIFGLPPAPHMAAEQLPTRMVWIGGFPAHYMGEFHSRLQKTYAGVTFIYLPLGRGGRAFSHEMTRLPGEYFLAPNRIPFLWVWLCLERMSPRAILIAGNYPRANLVAAVWACWRGRELYYLADSNPLDRRNLRRNLLNSLLLEVVLRKVTKILCIGTRNAEFYLQYRAKEHLAEVLLAFPLPHLHQPFEASKSSPGDTFCFLVLGRLDAVKAVDRVISAYALLSPQLQERSRLVIAGDGPCRAALESQVDALGLRVKVEFLGAVPSDQAPGVFGAANALVVASLDEPWGLVVNEAMSSGIPVIGPFWVGAFADLLIPGETGIVTRDNSPVQLSVAMQVLITDPERAAAMGQAGRVHVRERGWNIDGSLQAFGQLPVFKESRL